MKGWVYMNWVAPIKDSETLSKFKEALKNTDYKYYIMFEIGTSGHFKFQKQRCY